MARFCDTATYLFLPADDNRTAVLGPERFWVQNGAAQAPEQCPEIEGLVSVHVCTERQAWELRLGSPNHCRTTEYKSTLTCTLRISDL